MESHQAMKISSLWILSALLCPISGIGAEFDEIKARHAADADLWRRAALIAEANAPSIVTGATTQTVVTARDARLADREAKYLAELTAAGLSVTNDFDAAADSLNANGNNTATLRLGLRLFSLRARIVELGGDPKAATGATSTTNSVVTIQRTSPALQRLGRAATGADLERP